MRIPELARMALLASVLGSPLAFAGGHEVDKDSFSRAFDAHSHERYAEAAAGFIASFGEGLRKEASAYNAACALARAGRKNVIGADWI